MSEQRVALVTGASRGIGAAIAERLAADGFFVWGSATSEAGAERITQALGDQGSGLIMQLQSLASVNAAIEQIQGHGHVPQVIINNAGITRDNLMLRMSDSDWQDVLDTNLGGTFRVTKALLRGLVKSRWGRVINIGSVVGRLGNAGQTNYVTSKAGLEGFTRSLALEVGSRGITVNAVAPGFIETDMTDQLTDLQRGAMLERIPLGRMGQAAEIAALVSFLCSEEAGYITGQTLQVNGGLFLV